MPILDIQSMPPQKSAALTNILNSPPSAPMDHDHRHDNRDSAYSSKHTSGASFNGGNPPGAGYPFDKPPVVWRDNRPQSILSPTESNMSVASMVSPAGFAPQEGRLSMERQPHHQFQNGHGDDGLAPGQQESRRQSVDSRFNQQMDDMELNGSPYVSHNASTTSFSNSTLGVQRTSLAHRDSLSAHRISNGYQPNAKRTPDLGSKHIRTAPAITGPATGTIARAAEPTKGQAWAFPEMEAQGSRRSSMADSLASSQFTDSRLPPGQRPLHGSDYPRMSEDLKSIPQTFQHRQVAELLQQEEMNTHQSQQQPYSRTPELRISHKLAERKRRTEMKELFEQLREMMPQERGSKASKWEILTKAIAEHQRLVEINKNFQHHLRAASNENAQLRQEINRLHNERARSDAGSMHRNSHHYDHEHYPPTSNDQLPPLRNIGHHTSVPESMSGVQYDQPRHSQGSGYRH